MNSKKIISLVVAVAVAIAAYFAYKKFFPAGFSGLKANSIDSDDENSPEQLTPEEEAVLAVETLTEAQKRDAYNLANEIYEDCVGWNGHVMTMYEKLNDSTNAFFYFFVTVAYPSYDKKSLKERLNMQNWNVLKTITFSKANVGYTGKKARALISQIIYRIENFNF
ncbi:MAG: hypothetical protein VB046_06850 [Paludibacter sp.]|nr:hypothetical protein [Paludibacter sp.]